MARLRTIKPEFFQNEDLGEVSMSARLLFIGLWTLADRRGILEDRPKRIKASLFPYDDVDVDSELDVLAERGFITRYVIDGVRGILVNKFSEHQSPHVNERANEVPAPNEYGAETARDVPVPDQHQSSTVLVSEHSDASTIQAPPLLGSGYRVVSSGNRSEAPSARVRETAEPEDMDRITELMDAYREGLGLGPNDAGWHSGGNAVAFGQARQITEPSITAAEIRGTTAWLLDSWRNDGKRPLKAARPKLVPHVIEALQAWRDDGSPTPAEVTARRRSPPRTNGKRGLSIEQVRTIGDDLRRRGAVHDTGGSNPGIPALDGGVPA